MISYNTKFYQNLYQHISSQLLNYYWKKLILIANTFLFIICFMNCKFLLREKDFTKLR